jgi:hypothetical protein
MGLFDTIIIEEGIELPEFPDDGDPDDLDWQTKDIGHPSMSVYKITDNGRLLRKEVERAEMTQEEMDEYARDHGYESWEVWENTDTKLNEPLDTWKYKVVDEHWVDHNMHGSFEFHASTRQKDEYEDFYWSYEARFTKGQLDEILFLGERGSDGWESP